MTALEEVQQNPHSQERWHRRLLRGSRSTLTNLLILILPLALIIQGMSVIQTWLFQDQGALYFHAYRDTASNSAFVIAILVLAFFYIHALRAGIGAWRQTLKTFLVPLAVAVPLLVMVLDSYVMIDERQIVHSPFYTLGVEQIQSWEDVQSISVSYTVGEEFELFSGSYLLHFQDGTRLEIWKSSDMSVESLQAVDYEALKRGIPFHVSAPLSDQALNVLKNRGWTAHDRQFLSRLFQR
ncbi:hypothetical protein [Desmospora profundinema]|uniref:HTH LytTR-type domain-containing protein n=1 Tax=Desmospora profundinema TaxID=1571184 RepID=A0ABU1IMF2_9BACL|nr:hypothetical protein [Desmospora profundinema]MDR6225964.1 hypothetical protein [Desmospora profundinema]